MKKKLSACSLILGLILLSCSKEESLSKAELLCKDGWKIENATLNIGGTDEGSLDLFFLPCSFDDVTTYSMDLKFEREEGVDLCPVSTQIQNGIWTLTEGNTILNRLVGESTEKYDVVTLSESELILRFETAYAGVVGTMTWEFKH